MASLYLGYSLLAAIGVFALAVIRLARLEGKFGRATAERLWPSRFAQDVLFGGASLGALLLLRAIDHGWRAHAITSAFALATAGVWVSYANAWRDSRKGSPTLVAINKPPSRNRAARLILILNGLPISMLVEFWEGYDLPGRAALISMIITWGSLIIMAFKSPKQPSAIISEQGIHCDDFLAEWRTLRSYQWMGTVDDDAVLLIRTSRKSWHPPLQAVRIPIEDKELAESLISARVAA